MYNYNSTLENLKPEEILMYLRKSRADDPLLSAEEVLSKHEALLDEWADRNLSAPIPPENRFREIISGGESIADRPAFQKVLKLVESPKYRAVVVVDIPRLGRPDTEEIGRITKIFRYTGCLVITPMKTFDITNEYDRDLFERELKRGNEYLEYTKKILTRGRNLSAKNGNFISSRTLYGYDKVTITEGKRKCPTLAINEEQANIVRMVFEAYVHENIGTQAIANRLDELQIKPPQNSHWTADRIRRMLENPHYIGMVKWNRRKAVLVVDNGEFRKTRPKNTGDDFILVKGKHEAIISEELFNAAQEKRGRTHRTCDNKELRNPLASLLYCECGKAMSYRDSTRGNLISRGDPRLVCNGQHYCGNGSCSVTDMVDFVAEALRKRIKDFDMELQKGNSDSDKINEKLVKSLEKKLADISARELSLWESQVDPEIGKRMPVHIFQSLTDKLVKEREDTEASLQKAREALNAPIDYEIKKATLQEALDSLLDDEASVAEKNNLLKKCIGRITYHREIPQRILGKGNGRGYTDPPIELDIKLLL